jgi:hypothetical protein
MVEVEKILRKTGFQKMTENFDGSNIGDKIEKWHLYLRYTLIIEKEKDLFHLIDWKGDSVGPCHNIKYFYELKNPFLILYGFTDEKLNEWLSNYRDYKLNQII